MCGSVNLRSASIWILVTRAGGPSRSAWMDGKLWQTPLSAFGGPQECSHYPVQREGGAISALRSFLNVKSNADFVLVVSWLLSALRGQAPYPVLVVSGEQGSAKSTFSTIIRSLVDPNSAPLQGPSEGGARSTHCRQSRPCARIRQCLRPLTMGFRFPLSSRNRRRLRRSSTVHRPR